MRQDTPKPPTSEEALRDLMTDLQDHMNDPNDAIDLDEEAKKDQAEPVQKAKTESEESKKLTASLNTSENAAA